MRDWWRHAVIYQVYPRSFADADGDGVGDLPGIVEHLDYLNDGTPDSLGVDAIWISPFYPSPMADFGYDVAEYCDVDPVFGSLGDFDRLVQEVHRRGIRILVDLVPNHTSDRHPWFVESRARLANPRRDWYVWRDPRPGGAPPNNWRSAFPRVGSAWTLDPATGQCYLHSFLPQQPDLNWWNPAVRGAMDEVLRFWLDRGVDGFRIDVAHKMARDPELRDNPADAYEPGGRRRDEDWPEVHEILRGFRRTIAPYPGRLTVGEVWLSDPRRLAEYVRPDELDLVFDFTLLRSPWKAEAFRESVDRFEQVCGPDGWPNHTLSNHDNSRARSRYDPGAAGSAMAGDAPAVERHAPDGERRAPAGERRARLAALLLLTLRGTPFLYYGEEIGMRDGQVPPERALDVDGRDVARTPMQWDASPGAGFTRGNPWLPVGEDASTVNVAAQSGDPASLLALYRRLIWWRKGSPALLGGTYRPLATPPGIYAYLREAPGERLLVALNFVDRTTVLDASAAGLQGAARVVLATSVDRRLGTVRLDALELAPDEGIVVELGEPGSA